jgi:hypothetical protein
MTTFSPISTRRCAVLSPMNPMPPMMRIMSTVSQSIAVERHPCEGTPDRRDAGLNGIAAGSC